MQFLINNNKYSVGLIGDPHLGKQFSSGVPLSRRGEREEKQFAQFEREVCTTGVDTIVVMGDLFDKFNVGFNVIYKTYIALQKANTTGVRVCILQGNHDVSRDTNEKSALDVLEIMVGNLDNIHISRNPEIITTKTGEKLALLPYSEFETASDLASKLLQSNPDAKLFAAFGHWDTDTFGGSTHNLVPIPELISRCDLIVTGHVHLPKTTEIKIGKDTCTLIVTGSMQPYSHGEDPDGDVYVTLSLEELEEQLAKNPAMYHDKSVRLRLVQGQEPPPEVDALQFVYLYVSDLKTGTEQVEVKMETFLFSDVFTKCMKDNNVSDEDSKDLWIKYLEVAGDAENT